jgi:hypothetical protein
MFCPFRARESRGAKVLRRARREPRQPPEDFRDTGTPHAPKHIVNHAQVE